MDPLQLDIRRKIYDCIASSPGIHFREVQRRTGVAVGGLDYHLHFLAKHGLIRAERGTKTRYFPMTRNWDEEEKRLLGLLRQQQIRHILLHLLRRKRATPGALAAALGLSRPTLSWYLKTLADNNVIAFVQKGRFRSYRVKDPKRIREFLIVYRNSFFDEMVDNFIEAWEKQ